MVDGLSWGDLSWERTMILARCLRGERSEGREIENGRGRMGICISLCL